MARSLVLLLLLACLFVSSCAHKQGKPAHSSPTQVPTNPLSALDSPQAAASPGNVSLKNSNAGEIDPAIAAKVTALFESLALNDEKKSKFNYGRAVRSLPDLVQFAVDLRLRNYEHAQTVLPKTSMSDTQKAMWSQIIAKKPSKLSKAVCDEIVNQKEESATAAINPQDANWRKFWLKTVDDTAAKATNAPKEITSVLEEKLLQLQCNRSQFIEKSGNCEAISEDLQKEILTDSYFDKLHNMKRRDTRNVKQSFRNAVNLVLYNRHAYIRNVKNLLQFFRALNATETPKKVHFLRRFKGVGRDMRAENIVNRAMGDLFIEDDKDVAFVSRLSKFIDENQLIVELNRIESDLAECNLSGPKVVR